MDTTHDTSPADQFAAGAVVFAFVSLATCWWFPFGSTIGSVACAMGLVAWYGTSDGERALVGLLLGACGTGTGLLVAWEYWWRLLGV
jgi:hypothetical protein